MSWVALIQASEPTRSHGIGLADGAPTDTEVSAMAGLSLEELLKIRVVSVAKHEQSVTESPAAIFVLTQQDIERSGVVTLADALRLVPGLQVAKQSGYDWAITSRGFADIFGNKLLVMIDGRSVYTPLFSGVYWQVQDTLLEDVDRIEIIRGPGASLWGANAVNGIVHILTKSAKETQGTLITAGGGVQEKAFGAIRYGGKLSDKTFFRIYGKFFEREDSSLSDGSRADDRWESWRGGFRVDSHVSDANTFTLQGDLYEARMHESSLYGDTTGGGLSSSATSKPNTMLGQNILGRWHHDQSATSQLELQAYIDRTVTHGSRIDEERDTVDVNLQQSFGLGTRNTLMFGGGYRFSKDDLSSNFDIQFKRQRRGLQLFNVFVQDELTLVPERWKLTLGTKIEHNDFTGVEVQPTARVMWTPNRKHSLWAAVSRAVRTPSRAERDVRLNLVVDPAPAVLSILGNTDLRAEELTAFEVGHRWQCTDRLTLDTTAFYNQYSHLRISPFYSSGLDPEIPAALNVLALRMSNRSQGEVYGGEAAVTWWLREDWRLRPSYSLLLMRLHRDEGIGDATDEDDEGRSPVHQFSVHSSVDLPHQVTWDTIVRYVDRLRTVPAPAYLELDLRVGWRPIKSVELSISGQNLLDNHHPEFRPTTFQTQSTEVPRSIYGKVTLRF